MPGVFLSHSSQDKNFVTKLAIDLVNRGYPVWFDTWEMDAGDSLLDRIYQGIDESTVLVIILSLHSVASRWVQKELNGALSKEEQIGRRFIIPIKMSECEVPLKIADRIFADFTGSYLAALEKLTATLQRAGLNTVEVAPQHQLVPLVFTKGVYLNESALQKRVAALLPQLPPGFQIKANQLVVSPDEKYALLRQRLVDRVEHIEEDPFHSSDLEQSLTGFYNDVLKLEEGLIEGVAMILNATVFASERPFFSFTTACHWYARLVRTYLLSDLWSCQNPNLTDVSDYGKEYLPLSLLSNQSAARFFEVEAVQPCDIGPRWEGADWMSTGFTVWLDDSSSAVKCLREYHLPSLVRDFNHEGELDLLP